MHRLRIAIIFITIQVYFINIYAQLSEGGNPISFYHNNLKTINFEKVNRITSLKSLIDEDNHRKDLPFRFGVSIPVSYNMYNSGVWDTLANGDKLWRLAIKSDKAYSINLIFDKFRLSGNCKFYIYSSDRNTILGAYTQRNNRPDSLFATTLIKGNSIVLEYYEPKNTDRSIISIKKVIHGYKDILARGGFGNSGQCNVNINCSEGKAWQNEKNSVALIMLNDNTRLCSGVLLNCEKEDKRPFFLTANHCISYPDDEKTWIFMFGYESPDCNNIDGPTNKTIMGSKLLATDSQSDFLLVELSSIPPQEYNVYYAGWSAINAIPTNAVTIHHPMGDIKKISVANGNLFNSSWSSDSTGTHWGVKNWAIGTTEEGSSGGPLFDNNHRVIGQLHGGDASCDNNSSDYFGKFAYSWAKGSSKESRLKDWLTDNPSVNYVDGKRFITSQYKYDLDMMVINRPAYYQNCTKKIVPVVEVKNSGNTTLNSFNVYYKIDNEPYRMIKWTGKLEYTRVTSIALDTIVLTNGKHMIKMYADMPNDSIDENHWNDTIDKLIYEGYDSTKILIQTDGYGSEISWILTNINGDTINYHSNITNDTLYTENVCLANGCYNLIIKDSYGDGMSNHYDSTKIPGTFQVYFNSTLIVQGKKKYWFADTLNFCLLTEGIENKMRVKTENNINIYPNPSEGFITISNINHANNNFDIKVFNIYGKMVYCKQNYIGINHSINLTHLTNGVYFINLSNKYTSISKKIIINR